MSVHDIKSLEIHRGEKVSAQFKLFSGNSKVPPTLRLDLQFHYNGKVVGNIKNILGVKENRVQYSFDRNDVEDVLGLIREYEGLYDGWIDSQAEANDIGDKED